MSNVVEMIAKSPLPASFHGDEVVYAINLAGMTAFFYLGIGVVGWMSRELWRHRAYDRWSHPITLFRAAWLCSAIAVTMRSGGAAANLWAWDAAKPRAGAWIVHATRYTDPMSFIFTITWMTLLVVSYPAIRAQLIRQPLPVQWYARLPSLCKPIAVAIVSVVMSVLVVILRH